jgi:nitrogen fixation protein NifX
VRIKLNEESMSDIAIDRDTALRIALAARILPGVEVATLLSVLDDCLGQPLGLDSLSRITVTDLKTGLGSLDGEEDGEDISVGLPALKDAVRILWGESDGSENLPKPVAYEEGDMPGSIRVGLSSNSGTELDGHFGSCLRYLVYQVSPGETRLVDVRETIEADLSDDRNAFRASLVNDCKVLYMVSVGGPAAAKIIRAGVYPIKKIEGGSAEEVLAEFQQMMASSPPPWLAKILGVSEQTRIKNYDGSDLEAENAEL